MCGCATTYNYFSISLLFLRFAFQISCVSHGFWRVFLWVRFCPARVLTQLSGLPAQGCASLLFPSEGRKAAPVKRKRKAWVPPRLRYNLDLRLDERVHGEDPDVQEPPAAAPMPGHQNLLEEDTDSDGSNSSSTTSDESPDTSDSESAVSVGDEKPQEVDPTYVMSPLDLAEEMPDL